MALEAFELSRLLIAVIAKAPSPATPLPSTHPIIGGLDASVRRWIRALLEETPVALEVLAGAHTVTCDPDLLAVLRPIVHAARPSAESRHFEFTDDGTPKADRPAPSKAGNLSNKGMDLYQDHVIGR